MADKTYQSSEELMQILEPHFKVYEYGYIKDVVWFGNWFAFLCAATAKVEKQAREANRLASEITRLTFSEAERDAMAEAVAKIKDLKKHKRPGYKQKCAELGAPHRPTFRAMKNVMKLAQRKCKKVRKYERQYRPEKY